MHDLSTGASTRNKLKLRITSCIEVNTCARGIIHVLRAERGKERRLRVHAEDNLSESTARRNAIDYDLWRDVAGRTTLVGLVIRKI